jgi:hypothetical protein
MDAKSASEGLNAAVPESDRSLYDSLHRGHFRLLKLINRPEDTLQISCELRPFRMEDAPDYTALSYTWGAATNARAASYGPRPPMREIICNGRVLDVTENLFDFLLMARQNSQLVDRYFWIDAVCINQQDMTERSSHVKDMAQVYSLASLVLIWLGDGDGESEKAIDLMKFIGQLSQESLDTIKPGNLEQEDVAAMLGQYSKISYWRSLATLFQRRYFSRTWIIQEVILASKATVYCSSHSVEADLLDKASKFLSTTAWTRWLRSQEATQDPEAGDMKLYHGTPNMLQIVKRSTAVPDKTTLLYTVIRARLFLAMDPRDKVYALLGLAGEAAREKPRYAPIYGDRTVVKTFTDAAIQMLEDSDDLLLVAHAEGEKFRNIPSLPSWVPDWSCPRYTGLGVTGYRRFSAAGSLQRSLSIIEDGERPALKLEGIQMDGIHLRGESKHQILSESAAPLWEELFATLPATYCTGQPREEVFWRTLLTDTAGSKTQHPAPGSYGPAFRDWIRRKLGAGGEHGEENVLIDTFGSWQPNRDDAGGESVTWDEYETAYSYALNLCPFVTDGQYFGIGSESLREGDTVWIIKGSRVPLILRENRDPPSTYQIVGGAYVHGFMHGEWLETHQDFQGITVV